MDTDTAVMIFVAFMLGMALFYYLKEKKAKSNKEQLEYVGNYRMKLKKRASANAGLLSIRRHYELQNDFHPTTATYTSATVGGVTTGGWTIDEAHYTSKLGKATNKYELYCKGYDPNGAKTLWHPVQIIELCDADVNAAKKAGLNSFLSGNTLVLKREISSSIATDVLKMTGNLYDAQNFIQSDITDALYTKEELQKVVDFLCNQ